MKSFSRVRLLVTPWTAANQAVHGIFSVHGIFQARVLEWVVIAFSVKKASSSQISFIFMSMTHFELIFAYGKR